MIEKIPRDKIIIILTTPRCGANAFAFLLCELQNRLYLGEHFNPENPHNSPRKFEWPLKYIPKRCVIKITPYQSCPSDLLERDDVFIINLQRKDIMKQSQQIDSELRWNHKPAIDKIKQYNNWLNSFKHDMKIYIENTLQYFPKDKYPIREDGVPTSHKMVKEMADRNSIHMEMGL